MTGDQFGDIGQPQPTWSCLGAVAHDWRVAIDQIGPIPRPPGGKSLYKPLPANPHARPSRIVSGPTAFPIAAVLRMSAVHILLTRH
jgi:hypothetical protein